MTRQEREELKKQIKETVKQDKPFMRLAKSIIENKYNPGE